jgi:putative endonuclease
MPSFFSVVRFYSTFVGENSKTAGIVHVLGVRKIKQKRITMAQHNDFGKKGEDLAVEWLIHKGYRILQRNWRHGRYEVDIIACSQDVYHFIEVKSRQSDKYGHPEQSVHKNKIRRMMLAGLAWQRQYPGRKRIQYDVLAITVRQGAGPEYFLIGDLSL